MHAYLFILPIEPVEIGEIYEHLPLHCTLMPWFRLTATPEELLEKISMIFERHGPLELISAAPALFGPNDDIPVHTLASNPSLINLHNKLFVALNEMDAIHTERKWTGNGFAPHVATKNKRAFPPDSHARINEVYLFEALDAEKLSDRKALAELSLLF